MQAIIVTGGKQYVVNEGDTLFIEKLPVEAGDAVTFDQVLAIVDGDEANAVRLDANFDEDWGDKLELTPVLIHGEKKSHTLEIRLVSGDASMPSTFDVISVIGSVK